MASVDHWHNREGSQCLDIETATRLLIGEAGKQFKGRTMRPQLPDLLATAIEEVLEKTDPEGRATFHAGIVDATFFKRLEKQFNRVQDRYSKRRKRRPTEEMLFASPVAPPSEPAVELEHREQKTILRQAVDKLPKELKEVIELDLESMRRGKRGPSSEAIQKALGIARKTYRVRLSRALAELKHLLNQDEAL